MKPTLICDTREKNPLIISDNRTFADVIRKKLDTGDYSIDGLEPYLCIERKGCVSEFAGNLFQDRFDRELQRMMGYRYSFILLEFTLEEMLSFPNNAGLSTYVKKRIKYNGKVLLKRMIEIQCKYPTIHIIFCGEQILEVLSSICKRVVEREMNAVI